MPEKEKESLNLRNTSFDKEQRELELKAGEETARDGLSWLSVQRGVRVGDEDEYV